MIGASRVITPTQQAAARQHKAFRDKIAARAVPDAGIVLKTVSHCEVRVPPPAAPEPDPPISFKDWSERQRSIHPKIWFSIRDDRPARRPPSIAKIQEVVADFYRITRRDICGGNRITEIVLPRQIGYYLARMLTPHGMPTIGYYFGGRDHTSILSGIRKIAALIQRDPGIATDVETIRQLIMVRA